MPPSRTRDKPTKDEDESHSADSKRQKYKKKANPEEPGVQKLKASLRQTRRLLAKDNLAPDVQIQTERRLKSLESDLAKAEIRKKERSMAVRYHKIKFFDKQKVTRKINQTKRALEAPELEKKERKKLQKELLKHRIDLNYIIDYPKLDKYISLYPSTTSSDTDTSETDQLREKRRAAVREAMENGEMDAEPEMKKKNLDGVEEEDDDNDDGDEQEEDEDEPEEPAPKPHDSTKAERKEPKKSEKKAKTTPTPAPSQKLVKVQEDDFFDT